MSDNYTRIRITKVEEITAKNGNKFTAYKAVQKNGKLIDVRFRREVGKDAPDHPCIVVVQPGMYNIDRNRQYPCVWIKEIVDTEEFEPVTSADDIF